MAQQIPVSCNRDCGGSCPLLACVENGLVTRLVDNPAGGSYMHGCVRGYQMHRVVHARDRLHKPLLRKGPRGSGDFQEIDWPAALDIVANRLAGIRDRYGPTATVVLGGSGSCRGALHNTGALTARFFAQFGGFTETESNYSSAALRFVLPHVFGTAHVGTDAATLQFSKLIVLWGANVVDCRFGPELLSWLREAKRRGTPIIVIDPRRSCTVEQLGSRWLPVRPGTDSALMLSVLYVLLIDGLVDREFVRRYSTGMSEIESYVLGSSDGVPKTPEWASGICGLPAGEIVDFARLYGRSRPTALLPGLSIQRTLGGEESARLGMVLQAATGNLGITGGSAGAQIWGGLPGPRVGSLPVPSSPAGASIPVYRWPDAILEGRSGGYPSDIHAIYNVGGNYLVQGSDVHKNVRAFEKVDFAVTHDYFLTPSARYSDIVLPATTFLERNDIVSGTGNYVLFSNQAVQPAGQCRNDYDIFCDLAERLGFRDTFSEGKDEDQWLRGFVAGSDVVDYDEFRQKGIFFGENQQRVGLAEFVADPELHPLNTPSGRVELAAASYATTTGFSAVPQSRVLPVAVDYPLRLVTPKSRYRVHSQNANIAWFVEREPQALWMNCLDAEARQITDGDSVRVSSPQGVVRVTIRVTEDIMPGVVCLLQGAWPIMESDGIDVAGSANLLTSTEPTLPSQGARTHSVLVQVSLA